MILCITPNPAIDRTLVLPGFTLGEVHRAQRTIVAAGGKGLNVARTIGVLGGDPLCMGFAGGHAGKLLAELAQADGLNAHWTWTEVETRTCTILVSGEGDATVINEPGMPVLAEDWEKLNQDVREQLVTVERVCISGSLPPGSAPQDFSHLLTLLVEAGKEVWVDTSGTALKAALEQPGICIKANGEEIGQVLSFDVRDVDSAARALLELGRRNFRASLVTLGSAGAVLATKDGRWRAQGPHVEVVSTVGSGDAFLGGLVAALDQGTSWADAIRDGVAAGTANALSAGGGQFRLEEFEEIRTRVQIKTW